MFRKTTMAALVAAIAILGVVAVLQTGEGADEVSAIPRTSFRMRS